ncbi:MaoC family dehydratase [Variovorax sp. SCN 67-20]|uniref:MaoC family dehydratase n=1 Tax=Variovorax sp. SCN 67-20 TaxID=1660153 RepID=UPI00344E700D
MGFSGGAGCIPLVQIRYSTHAYDVHTYAQRHRTGDDSMAGKWFEEFVVDTQFDHEIRRTVLESDNMWFSNATCNPAAIHIDAEYAKGTEFGKPLMNSIFTLGLVIGLSVQDTTLGTTVANLGMTDVRFPAPVFAGDTLRSRTTVLEVRASKSRPNAGIVTFLHQGFNQRDEEVATLRRQALMLRKPEAA